VIPGHEEDLRQGVRRGRGRGFRAGGGSGEDGAIGRGLRVDGIILAVAGLSSGDPVEVAGRLNSVQTLVLQKMGGRWWIVLYQNTPAQFHGRPELVKSLTEEVREARTSKNK